MNEPQSSPQTFDGVTYRPATLDDHACVEELLQPFVDQRLLLKRTPEELDTLLRTGFIAWLETQAEPQAVGFCAVEIYSKKLAEIQCLCVRQEYQRHGIGRQLVKACVELAKERGVMEVMAISSSEKFLQDLGFDYSLPQQKRALFFQIRSRDG